MTRSRAEIGDLGTVVGIDLSLTASGVAVIQAEQAPRVYTVRSGPGASTVPVRHQRINQIAEQVGEYCYGVDLAVIEGPSLGSATPHTWDRAGLWWAVIDRLMDRYVPIAEVPPATLKKFASGSGRGDKAAVAVGLVRLWGEQAIASNDNEWDALALATMGGQRIGLPVPSRAHHAESLAKVKWPEIDARGYGEPLEEKA